MCGTFERLPLIKDKVNLFIDVQQREILELLTEVANSDTIYSNTRHKLIAKKLISKYVVCGNCDGWGYTIDENGRRKEHCKECE